MISKASMRDLTVCVVCLLLLFFSLTVLPKCSLIMRSTKTEKWATKTGVSQNLLFAGLWSEQVHVLAGKYVLVI